MNFATAVQPHPEPLMKLSGFVIRAGKKGYIHALEQLWASSLPCLAFPWLSFRQVHQPPQELRITHAQEKCCMLGKAWGTATCAWPDDSTVLTHSGLRPESAAVTGERKATYKPNGNGGAGGAEPKGTATSVSWGKRRGSFMYCRMMGSAALQKAPWLCQKAPWSQGLRALLLSPGATLLCSSEQWRFKVLREAEMQIPVKAHGAHSSHSCGDHTKMQNSPF